MPRPYPPNFPPGPQFPPGPPFGNDRDQNNYRNNPNNAIQLGAPPQRTPNRPMDSRGMTRAVDKSSIRFCMRRFTYVWLDNGQEFWLYPVQVGNQSVAGFRWDRRFGWSYIGVPLNRIDFFTCSV